ncbi:MAG: hypothetical protein VKJ02_10075 [Snowella sp.]|nr:hypothetical protein [Snowella sp.]
MSNSDFFSLLPEDESSPESLNAFFEMEQVPTLSEDSNTQEPLMSLDDLFSKMAFNDDSSLSLLDNLDGLDSFEVNSLEAVNPPSTIAVMEMPRSPDLQFVSPLTPPLLLEQENLTQELAVYKQALQEAERQLEGKERRSQSTDQLIDQQAEELSKIQEHLAYTVAELQVHQEEAQRQQLQLETVTEKLTLSQSQVAQLERDCSLLKETCQEKTEQLQLLEQQIEELRVRLQRQQRYSLQYKTALEQCLATPSFSPSSDVAHAIASLTGQTPIIQPWSLADEPTTVKVKEKMEINASLPNADDLTAEHSVTATTHSLTQAPVEPPRSLPTETMPEPAVAQTPIPEPEPRLPFPPKRDRALLSFAIRPNAQSARRNIDLPQFVRQTSAKQ